MNDATLVIVGAGSAGIAAAAEAAQRGAQVVLIEQERIGGTCLQRGCIPTVVHLQASRLRQYQQMGAMWGVGSTPGAADWDALHAQQDAVVTQLTQGTGAYLEHLGVSVLQARAQYLRDHALRLTYADGREESLSAPLLLLAQGAHCVMPDIAGLEEAGVWTTDHALGLVQLPGSVLVYGGGFIGIEWAQFLQTMGSSVTLATPEAELLPGEDSDITAALEFLLEEQHITVHTGWPLRRLTRQGGMTLAHGDHEILTVSRVLLGDCRRPWGDSLTIPGLSLAETGAVKVDSHQRTAVPGIFAAGDVTGGRMLSHWGRAQGIVAAQNALGAATSFAADWCPRVYHTHPEIAAVGLTEAQARREGDIVIGQSDLGMSARALTLGERLGFVKVIALKPEGKVVGVHMIGPLASEVIAQASLAIRLEALADDLAEMVPGHPTMAEALADAAREAVQQL